jgi:hypothetical protein
VREERVVLEDRVDVAFVRRPARDVLAGEEDAPRVRLLEAGDDPQRRRFPRPEGPSMVKNSPWAISRSTESTATTSP